MEGLQGLSPAVLVVTRPTSLSQGLLCEDGKQCDNCLAHREVQLMQVAAVAFAVAINIQMSSYHCSHGPRCLTRGTLTGAWGALSLAGCTQGPAEHWRV